MTFPAIQHFCHISAITGEVQCGVICIKRNKKRKKETIVSYAEVHSHALSLGLAGNSEVREALTFLHELGSVQYFSSEFLRDRVVINPQWLVDVMSCLISVKESIIKEGRFSRNDISKIWEKYEAGLHMWLLRLTEEFDLTYALPTDDVNVVPCLLPEQQPDVIDSLVHEFFQGVVFDLFIPCVDCVSSGSQDPHMFSARHVRRASELKAPFLQCGKSFHIVALNALQQYIPPANTSDYDRYLGSMMYDLKELRSSVETDVLLLFSEKDTGKKSQLGLPEQIQKDLENNGVTCNLMQPGEKGHSELGSKLASSIVVITCISENLCKDKELCNVIEYIKQSSHKHMIPVVISKGQEWKRSNIGMLMASEMFVDMSKSERYQQKFQELLSRIRGKLALTSRNAKLLAVINRPVFFSYCWANSHSAVKQGSAGTEASLGEVDPREIAEYLESKNISCWIDIRCAKEGALFEEISDALRRAKVFVACVSDEYLHSRNCMLEFRFAAGILKLPLILVVVGTGKMWQKSEVAMLALGAARLDFQTKNEGLLEELTSQIIAGTDQDLALLDASSNKKEAVGLSRKEGGEVTGKEGSQFSAYHELCELAQRKFLQRIALISASMRGSDSIFAGAYPRLYFLDLLPQENNDDEEKEEKQPERVPTAGSVRRPKSRGIVREDALELLEMLPPVENLCLRILCEYEGGWHFIKEIFPLNTAVLEGVGLLENLFPNIAAYQAAILSILQHSHVSVRLLEENGAENILKGLKHLAQEKSFEWKTIEVSDDEDDTHPNIYTPALFRLRHRSRLERMAEKKIERRKLQQSKKSNQLKVAEIRKKLGQVTLSEQEQNVLNVELGELEKQQEEYRRKDFSWKKLCAREDLFIVLL